MTSLLEDGGVDWDEVLEGGDACALWICWRQAGAVFELGGARLWSVFGPLRPAPLGLPLPLVVVVGASGSDMLGDVVLGGVERARLETVPVDDPGEERNGGEDDEVVGIHEKRNEII